MNREFFRELMRRRVPSIVGLYLAAGWGLLEFTDWATTRFDLPDSLEDGVVVTWAVLLPLVAASGLEMGCARDLSSLQTHRPFHAPLRGRPPLREHERRPGGRLPR